MFLQGTENVVLTQNNFTRLDGNAVMVSGYNRYTQITDSEFSWLGGNAVVAWGFTNDTVDTPTVEGETDHHGEWGQKPRGIHFRTSRAP